LFILRGDPGFEGGDLLEGTGPLAALHVGIALGVVVALGVRISSILSSLKTYGYGPNFEGKSQT
jgi:hypothetical protein